MKKNLTKITQVSVLTDVMKKISSENGSIPAEFMINPAKALQAEGYHATGGVLKAVLEKMAPPPKAVKKAAAKPVAPSRPTKAAKPVKKTVKKPSGAAKSTPVIHKPVPAREPAPASEEASSEASTTEAGTPQGQGGGNGKPTSRKSKRAASKKKSKGK